MSLDPEYLKSERSQEWRATLRSKTKNKERTAIHRVHMPEQAPEIRVKYQDREVNLGITDDQGGFARYKIKDPSFNNWFGLAMSLRNQQISDFPLCNKSFNLSYCGHDL